MLKYVYAKLVNEPFSLSLDEVRRLTDRQIFELYFAERDKEGQLLPPANDHDGERELSFEEYMAVGASFGIPAEQLRAEWIAKRGEP